MCTDTAAWSRISDPDRPLHDRVKAVYHYNCFTTDHHSPERLPPPFNSKGFLRAEYNGCSVTFTLEQQAARIRTFCSELLELVDETPSHLARLDRKFAGLLECDFQPTKDASPFCNEPSSEIEGMIVQRTLQFLRRLPETPLELPGLPDGLPSPYCSPLREQKHSSVSTWENLRITSYLNTNVIRVAMCIVIHPFIAKGKLSEFLNHIAALLESAAQSSAVSKKTSEKHKWFIIRAFLWVSWQRTVMLYFSFVLAMNLTSGVDDELVSTAAFLQGFSPISGVSIQDLSKQNAVMGKSQYMCTWAFELLRKNPFSISMDFKRFHELYANQFDQYRPRCDPNGTMSCKGDHPYSCQRFVGMVIKDQSAHDRACTDCDELIWDELSFRSVSGPKAVSLENRAGTTLRYRTASKHTLAVSHVWSHGQGGRPETGMNRCLHERYINIAKSMGCDSYWMDTPCIPTDHVLRHEAIMNINKIFAQSKVTLVCDRDLMEIEITKNVSIGLRELILVTVMTCDWNIRAWTFLEAFRARRSIYLLCKHNQIISLKETVEIVHREGGLDIGALLLTVPHLLPRVSRLYDPGFATTDSHPKIWEAKQRYKPLSQGFLTLENSGMFLRHRPASRPGDDIVIWSLLLDEKVYNSAIDFWRSRQGGIIHTSFLVSTTPRLNVWRFGWAPTSPRAFLDASAASASRSMGTDQVSSEVARITAEGLEGNWLFCELARLIMAVSALPLGHKALHHHNLRAIRKNFLQSYKWGALLRPVMANEPGELMAAPNQEDLSQVLVVVCGSNDISSGNAIWEWRGVHEWDPKEPLPTFIYKERILLI